MVKLASPSMLAAAAAVWPTASERQRSAMYEALYPYLLDDCETLAAELVGAIRDERKLLAGVLLATSTEDDVREAAEEMGISVEEFRRIVGGGR